MTDLWMFFRRLLRWIVVECWPLWLCPFVMIAAFGVSPLFGGVRETKIRIIGLLLQLCAIGTVMSGLRSTRKLFGYPGFVELLVEILKRFPKYKLTPISGEVHIPFPEFEVRGSGHSWQSPSLKASIEKRLEAFEANLCDVNQRLVRVEQRLDHETSRITSELHEEQCLRKQEDEKTMRKLVLSQTGGLTISTVGLVWLFWGVVLSTASTEIDKLFKCLKF